MAKITLRGVLALASLLPLVLAASRDPHVDYRNSIPAPFRNPTLNGVVLEEVTIDQLQSYFKKGTFTIQQYVSYCLERIQAVSSRDRTSLARIAVLISARPIHISSP